MAVSLNKVVLEKKGDAHRVDLTKASDQNIVINLNWSQGEAKGFFGKLFGGGQEIDLDLGVFWELKSGHKSIIDGLQFSKGRGGPKDRFTRQGCYTEAPWVWHCGDDRGTASSSGENILVNPKGIRDLKRLVVYCFIYEGAAKWAESDAVVTVKIPNQPEIVVEMGKQTDSRKFCAIASIDFDGNSMSVRKEITFHNDHSECDRHYGWGFNYSAGSK